MNLIDIDYLDDLSDVADEVLTLWRETPVTDAKQATYRQAYGHLDQARALLRGPS